MKFRHAGHVSISWYHLVRSISFRFTPGIEGKGVSIWRLRASCVLNRTISLPLFPSELKCTVGNGQQKEQVHRITQHPKCEIGPTRETDQARSVRQETPRI